MGRCVIASQECPRTANPEAKRFCPAWSNGVVHTNVQTGEEKTVHCSFEALMPALVEVIKASNRPAAAIESTRNELASGLSRIGKTVESALALEHQRRN